MPITDPEWLSIRNLIEKVAGLHSGKRMDWFVTGTVIEIDAVNRNVYMAEFGDQPIPLVAWDYTVDVYDETPAGTDTQFITFGPTSAVEGTAITVFTSPSFETDGREIAIIASGSAWYADFTSLQADVKLDGTTVFSLHETTNEANSHKAFPTGFGTVKPAAGSHTITIDTVGTTTTDPNDFYSVAVILPADTKVKKKTLTVKVKMPKVGDTIVVARELGTRRLPRALGILQGQNWMVAEDDQ